MRFLTYSLLAMLLPAIALGALKTRSEIVQKGVYRVSGCTHEPTAFANDCKCKADIERLQVIGGVADDVKARINAVLKRQIGDPPAKQEEGQSDFCEGRPASAKREENITIIERGMKLLYQNDTVATFSSSGYYYPAGAAHGMYGNTYAMVTLKDGEEFDPFAVFSAKDIKALDRYIKRSIRTTHAGDVFKEELTRRKPYVTKDGCDGCNVFYSGNGWEVEFQLYSIAPYSVGMVTIMVPESVLPSPHTLIAGK